MWLELKQAHGEQGIWDLNKVYLLPELFKRVSAGEVLEADSNLTIRINFTVFSFVLAYNNKNVGGLFGYNVTFLCPKPAPLILQNPYI